MDEKKRNSGEQPLGDLIEKLLKAYQLDDKMKEFDVISKWEEMMGRAVYLRTKQIHIKNKILFLKIDSSIMREELKYGKSVIIQRVNEYAGKEIITDVWFS
jgi:predicted nucleic acid-binding Zn ribbon protein